MTNQANPWQSGGGWQGGAGPPPGAPGPGYGPYAGELTEEVRNLAMAVHLLAFVGLVIPLGNIVAPLVLWLTRREKHPFIDEAGKQALNFNISFTIYEIVAAIAILIFVGIFLLLALVVAWVVLVIIASIRANRGEFFSYPVAIPFFR